MKEKFDVPSASIDREQHARPEEIDACSAGAGADKASTR